MINIPVKYILNIFSRSCETAVIIVGENIQYGYAGLLNLGMEGLAMVGAYTTAIMVTNFHSDFFSVMFVSILLTTIVATIIGFLTLRSRGDYFGIVTLGFGYIIYSLVLNYNSAPVRGALGIPGIIKPIIFGISFQSAEMFALLSLLVLVIVYLVATKITRSPYGRILRAVRDDEDSAMALGKNSMKYRLSAFVMGGIFASIGGAMYAYWVTYVEPKPFDVIQSVYVLFGVLIGGRGNLLGSILGAFILLALPEPLRFLNLPPNLIGGIQQLLFGLLLLFIVIYRPDGILKEKMTHYSGDEK